MVSGYRYRGIAGKLVSSGFETCHGNFFVTIGWWQVDLAIEIMETVKVNTYTDRALENESRSTMGCE